MYVEAPANTASTPAATQSAGPIALWLHLIGPMRAVTRAEVSVLPSGRKTRALLAVVALAAPRPALRARLAELLWSRRPEAAARASLRQEVHRLLEGLGPVAADAIAVTRDHLALRTDGVWTDVDEVSRATMARPGALSLLSAELLEGLDGIDPALDTWLGKQRERLRGSACALAEALLRGQSDPAGMILAAERVLTIDRGHEGAWRALMRAHGLRGERAMAIQAYERCRAILAERLDATPSAKTQALLAQLRGPVSGNAAAALAGPEMSVLDRDAACAPPPEPPSLPASRPEAAAARPCAEPRLGLLPLRLVGDAAGESVGYLTASLAEEITTALARFRSLIMVSSHALARLLLTTEEEGAIRQAFDLDFLMHGTIQKLGERLRVTVMVLDLHAGSEIVWSRRFDWAGGDLGTLQEDLAGQVAAQLGPELGLIHARRAGRLPATGNTAYGLLLRALPLMQRMERGLFVRAGEYLTESIRMDPDRAAAHAWFAYWHVLLVSQGWTADGVAALSRAASLAERAIQIDPLDARALSILGLVRSRRHRRAEEAMALHARAVALNPYFGMGWALSAHASICVGDLAEAERRFARYKTLSPTDPDAFFLDVFQIMIRLLQRDCEAAARTGRAVVALNPAFSAPYKPYLSALGHLGWTDEAEQIRERLLAVEPSYSVQTFLRRTALTRYADRAYHAEGLRLADVPEGE